MHASRTAIELAVSKKRKCSKPNTTTEAATNACFAQYQNRFYLSINVQAIKHQPGGYFGIVPVKNVKYRFCVDPISNPPK